MKRVRLLAGGIILAALICGCSLRKPASEITPETLPTGNTLPPLSSETKVDRNEQVGEKTISISTVVPAIKEEQLCTIVLEPDKNAWEDMGRNLFLDSFPQIGAELESGNTQICLQEGEKILLYFESMELGNLYYADCVNDVSGSGSDGDNSNIPHYITNEIPADMSLSAEEAAENLNTLLGNYSCLDFQPWNITAEYDNEKMKGAYHIYLRQFYQDVPIYEAGAFHSISAFVSKNGCFACQGNITLKEQSRAPIHSVLSLENAIEKFISTSPAYCYSNQVICNRVNLGYIPAANGNTIVLTPAWIFECQELVNPDNPSIQFTKYYNCGFYLETGDFWIE